MLQQKESPPCQPTLPEKQILSNLADFPVHHANIYKSPDKHLQMATFGQIMGRSL